MPALALASKIRALFLSSNPFLLSSAVLGFQVGIMWVLIRFTIRPTRSSAAAIPTHMPHCRAFRGVVFIKMPKNCTAQNWNKIQTTRITRRIRDLCMPSKMFTSPCSFRAFSSLNNCMKMNVLKRTVPCSSPPKHRGTPHGSVTSLISERSDGTFSRTQPRTSKRTCPSCMRTSRTASWNKACPKMNVHIRYEIKGAAREMGPVPFFVRQSLAGLSVARDRAANVSMMRLSHSSCTGFSGSSLCSEMMAPMTVSSTPAVLTVSWNCRNFRILSLTVRPQVAAWTTVEKLSSIRTMSDAPTATSVPVFIAKPTSAIFRAGASLVPSPVTATMSPSCIRQATSTNLSVGLLRASTRSFGMRLINLSGSSIAIARNWAPSMTSPSSTAFSGERMPHFLAMATAVFLLSPVTIRTEMPAWKQLRTAAGTSCRMGSWIPAIASIVIS
mmetsp:Transcript_67068/g.112530  ORF Transcript_67068/g.112530 Transcript_67068/m.112530 type:complete len:442 (+) Transcript_67068:901-2226(+)